MKKNATPFLNIPTKLNDYVRYGKKWREKNLDKLKAQRQRYQTKHRKELNDKLKIWQKENPERIIKYRKSYEENNPEKLELKNFRTKAYFLRKIDLSFDEFKTLLKKQKGLCAICTKPETSKHQSGKQRLLSIDHCHTTNKVRGLLCKKCNSAIGFFEDNPVLVKKAYDYLIKTKNENKA